MEVSIQLSCKKYVAHFLRQKHGHNPLMNKETSDGIFFLNILGRQRNHREKEFSSYGVEITVLISVYDFERYGGELTKTAMIDFNRFIERQLKQMFEAHMQALVDIAGFQQNAAIRLFQQKNGLTDEEWSFYALKKHYQRFLEVQNTLKAA